MTQPPVKPKLTPRGEAQAQARARREAEALRANLKRRKAPQRGRTERETAAEPPPPQRDEA